MNQSYNTLLADRLGKVWKQFVTQQRLDSEQAEKCAHYYELLCSWNDRMNLTAITDPEAIISDHFCDSLAAGELLNTLPGTRLADVGAGAGFPGIPLLIKYPLLSCVFIEVNSKKRLFLQTVIDALGLNGRATISADDWRTFLRQETQPVDIFVARASLRPDELVRAFGATTHFQQAVIIYWASMQWQVGAKEKEYLVREISYECGKKKRRLVVFAGRSNKR